MFLSISIGAPDRKYIDRKRDTKCYESIGKPDNQCYKDS